VTVARAGADMKPVPGTERHIDCDLLVLSVGLIPENELTQGLKIEMDPVTRGPVVDADMMTSAPGIFAAGNAVAVFDLVDYVSETGVCAARGAVKFLRGEHTPREACVPTVAGENVLYVLPQRVAPGSGAVDLYMRACGARRSRPAPGRKPC